jgi:hypothetical protein
MAASARQRDEMYELLLALSIRASRECSFEEAYHALAAAMHRAKDLADVPSLRELFQEAERQKRLIDTRYPDHPLSASSARSRGHESIYSSLLRQISTQLHFHETQHLFRDH